VKRPLIRILDLAGPSSEMGRTHGRAYADEIRQYTRERVGLVAGGAWSDGPIPEADVLALADSMLDAHRRFDEELYAELLAVADGAGITPAEAVVVGGFTDFVDTVRAQVGGRHPDSVVEDDCTAAVIPAHRGTGGTGYFGQTWDMHDSATDRVLLLRIQPDHAPAALVFTTTGCLGQIGMNELGVCVGINNLVCTDGTIGVAWTSVVRGMLKATSARDALDVLLGAELAGAHNYLILDADGVGFNVEAMPSVREVTELGDTPIVHTNHTLHPETSAVQADKDAGLLASSAARLARGRELLSPKVGPIDEQWLFDFTRDPEAICQVASEPFHIESSGAAVMRPSTREFWACWGPPSDNSFLPVEFPARSSAAESSVASGAGTGPK
jgi:isopenicillin-N N-acyltransferase-like protein